MKLSTGTRQLFAVLCCSLLNGCVIDPNAFPSYPANEPAPQQDQPPPSKRSFIKKIQYASGDISYFRTNNAQNIAANIVRICLINNTGQPKAMIWSRIASGVNNMRTPKNGSRSCVSLSTNQRIEWTFVDRLAPVKREGMNLQGFGGSLVEFIWVRDY